MSLQDWHLSSVAECAYVDIMLRGFRTMREGVRMVSTTTKAWEAQRLGKERVAAARASVSAIKSAISSVGGASRSERDAEWAAAVASGEWAATAEGRERRRAEQTSNIQLFDALSVSFVTIVGAVCALVWFAGPLLVPDGALDPSEGEQAYKTINVSGADGSRWFELLNVTGKKVEDEV